MASKNIKGLTVEIGGDTTQLGKALDGVNKKGKDLSRELSQINGLLKLDPGNADLIAQKQKVLAEAVSNTAAKLETLEEAERQVQEQFKQGKVSEAQVRELKREIIDTTKRLEKYQQEAEEVNKSVDQLGDESQDAAKDVKKMGDSASKAEDEADDLGSTLSGSLSKGFTAATALAAAASAAIIGCVESSHEYRTAMGKLIAAFETSGHTGDAATTTYKELQSILGETDQAVEAANHLAKLCDTEEELAEWTEIATGVYAAFGDSLSVEGLTEAANETAKTGQVTGALADALNWAAEEGETFGVELKKNIKFTKLEKKELDKLTDTQREEYENRKEQYEAIEKYNQSVEEATTAEDKFNIALENCTSEQERQELITKTLTKSYKKAAEQYKAVNKDVIEANKANEEWNATMAELGAEMQPAVTEIKKFGTELLKNAKEPLKDTGKFITGTVLPALADLGKWVQNNTPIIKTSLAAVVAGLVAYKVATIATEVAQKGLKGAILATTAAQKALDLVQKASPWGLVATAITAVIGALAVYNLSLDDTTEKVDVLTEEERELMTAADEAAEAFREQKKARDEDVAGIDSQMGHVQDLADELRQLADAGGMVDEGNRERAEFILNQLNEALGTEYEMVDGVIQQYGDLKKNIDELIVSKTANAMLEAGNALYVEALQAENQAMQDLVLSEKDYQAQLEVTQEAERVASEASLALQEKVENARGQAELRALDAEAKRVQSLQTNAEKERELLTEKENAYNDAAANYGAYSETISDYEEAQTAAMEGNYERTVEILKGKSASFDDYADDVDQATREVIDSLYKEAIDAGIEAERTRRNFEKGIEGYTEKMVKEAEQGYEDALDEWATAKTDAESVGEDLSDGLSGGMESRRSSLITKAKSIVSNIISAFREEADSNSPSKKMIDFGEDMGEGADIGLENKTPDMLKTARKQVQGLMDTYQDEGEATGQTALRSVAERSLAQNAANVQGLINGNNSKLDQILQAIKAGQTILLDGELLVGGTSDRMDSKLGQRRAMVARGAL